MGSDTIYRHSSHRCKVNPEMICDLLVRVCAGRMGTHNGGNSIGTEHFFHSNPFSHASSNHQPGALNLRHTGLAHLPKVIFRLLCYPRVGLSAILNA